MIAEVRILIPGLTNKQARSPCREALERKQHQMSLKAAKLEKILNRRRANSCRALASLDDSEDSSEKRIIRNFYAWSDLRIKTAIKRQHREWQRELDSCKE